MPHHKSGCTGAIQPSCHHQRLLDQQGASMYGPLLTAAIYWNLELNLFRGHFSYIANKLTSAGRLPIYL
jgi:hypothetical protein